MNCAIKTGFVGLLLTLSTLAGCGGGGSSTTPADTTPPTVVSTNPTDNATNVALNTTVSATFSEAMDSSSLNTSTFTLAISGGAAVGGAVGVSGNTATFTPSASLAANTQYTATVTTGAKDAAGNALAANKVWTFTTLTPDTTPPTVVSTNPTDNATGVALNITVSAVFSEAMDNSTLNTSTFTLAISGGAAVGGAVGVSGNTATFTPSASLAANTQYTATVTTGAKDLAGNALAADKVWTFTTGTAGDTTPPTVTSTIPSDGSVGQSNTSHVRVTFSEAMNPASVNASTFTLAPTAALGSPVAGTITARAGDTSFVFKPTGQLTANTSYTATITTGAQDLAGNGLAADFTFAFSTATTTYRVSTTVPATANSLAASVVLVDPTPPHAKTSFPGLVNPAGHNSADGGRISYVQAGTIDGANKQIRDRHRHAVVFANGGKVWKLSTLVTGIPPVPAQISNISNITDGPGDGSANALATDLCQVYVIDDFANVDNTIIAILQAGPDKTCDSKDEDISVTSFAASSATAPFLNWTFVSPAIIYDASTGAIDSLLTVTAPPPNDTIVRLSGPNLATQTAVTGSPTGVTEMQSLTLLNDGRTLVLVHTVSSVNGEVRVYDPGTNSIGTARYTFAAPGQFLGQFASEGTNVFFTDSASPNVIRRISFGSNPAGTVSEFYTGAAGPSIKLNTVTPTPTGGPTGRLIFQENGTIKSVLKNTQVAGTVDTLVSPPVGGDVIFVGATNSIPVKVYANTNSNANPAIPGSGTWTAHVVDEDGTGPDSHADARWSAGSFRTTVNLYGIRRDLRHIVLLTRAVAAIDDQGGTLANFFANDHVQVAALGTVPANVEFLGDPSLFGDESSTKLFSRERGGAKLLLQATYTNASGLLSDAFFVDPNVDNSLVNVGDPATGDIPFDLGRLHQ